MRIGDVFTRKVKEYELLESPFNPFQKRLDFQGTSMTAHGRSLDQVNGFLDGDLFNLCECYPHFTPLLRYYHAGCMKLKFVPYTSTTLFFTVVGFDDDGLPCYVITDRTNEVIARHTKHIYHDLYNYLVYTCVNLSFVQLTDKQGNKYGK